MKCSTFEEQAERDYLDHLTPPAVPLFNEETGEFTDPVTGESLGFFTANTTESISKTPFFIGRTHFCNTNLEIW